MPKSKKQSVDEQESSKTRIGIIGGGISGLYTAWRLSEESAKYDITIFEASKKLGGRIRSQDLKVLFKAELGAMRFRKSHKLLNSLISELKIETCEFDFNPPVYYVRGRRLYATELVSGKCSHCQGTIPFLLQESERNMSPVDLIKRAIWNVLKHLEFPLLSGRNARKLKSVIAQEKVSPQEWREIKEHGTFNYIPLYGIGFWNLLQHTLSNEAYVFIHEGLSLESTLGNWNAAEAIPWFLSDFSSDEYEMISKGSTELVNNLEAILNERNVHCRIESKVRKISLKNDKWHVDDGSENSPVFDKIILALPKMPLKRLLVDIDGKEWPKPDWIEWVKGNRLFKLFLLFESVWWMGDDVPGHASGRVLTDLPLRHIFYFSTNWMREHGKTLNNPETDVSYNENRMGMIMASYSDEHYVAYWEPLLHSGFEEKGLKHYSVPYYKRTHRVSDNVWNEVLNLLKDKPEIFASQRMIDKVLQMLGEIHGRHENVPDPICGVFMDWGQEPFGGGWHTWEVGSRSWEVEGQLTRPLYESDKEEGLQKSYVNSLFLCGEAYSTEQGWIEGALKTSERVLKHLGLRPPKNIRNYEEYIRS